MDRDPGMRRLYAFAGCRSLIANADDLATFQCAQIAHDIRPPIAIADNAKTKHRSSPHENNCVAARRTIRAAQQPCRTLGEKKREKISGRKLAGTVSADDCFRSLQKNF